MFEAAETGQRLSKQDFETREAELRLALVNAQYDLQSSDAPMIVLISGDDRPGASAVLNRFHEWMDGRYLVTRAFGPLTEAERLRPAPWRFWNAMPARGRVALFLGGWAQSPLAARLEGRMDREGFDRAVDLFNRFEEAFRADGGELVKLWIHLPKAEHEKRLAKASKGRGESWRVDDVDWRICDTYDEMAPVAEELVERSAVGSPWHLVEATDPRFRDVYSAERVLAGLESVLSREEREPEPSGPTPISVPEPSVLDGVDLTRTLDPDEYKKELAKQQRRLAKLAARAAEAEMRVILVFEGWDAAGKGGAIRRLTRALDARDVDLVPIAAPSEEERRYHYLWRFWQRVPRAGRMVIFDRSWYGRVLVERVEGFAREDEWRRAYAEINEFERELVDDGSIVLKFWLHIDRDEQLRRFRDRERTPYKKYKITDEDYRNRERWDAYVAAVHDMVERTSTSTAPWHLVAANDKRAARVEVIDTVCETLKHALKKKPKRRT